MENRRITSKKRQAIYNLLCASYEHPTAEMLYSRLKPDFPELSLGTVYRNLSVLEEDGLVVRVGKVDGQERYDARLMPHAHFVCSSCHRVADLELSDTAERLVREINDREHCRVDSFTLTVHGVCEHCRSIK